jgi:hypothetical protein
MGQKIINVNRSGSELTVNPDHLDLEDGDWVEWEFVGLDDGEFGFISFADPLPRLGPFYSLRSLAGDRFLGKGNKGRQDPPADGKYEYQALVLDPTKSDRVASGTGTIQNRATAKNTAPEILVTYFPPPNPNDPKSPATLTVTPDPVGLNWGDTATWLFKNLPSKAFACFRFIPDANTPGMDKALGPFLAFNASEGDHDVAVRASAMGFAIEYPLPEAFPSFTYHVELRDWEGKLLASHDPAIDNLGPPPPIG